MACLGRPSAALQQRTGSVAAPHPAARPAGSRGGVASRQLDGGMVAAADGGRLGSRFQLRFAARTTAARAAAGSTRTSGSGSTSGSCSGGNAGDSETQLPRKRGGSKPRPVPDVDAEQLLHSCCLSGSADPAALLRNLRKLPGVRQQGVLNNAAAVTAHLLSQAVGLTAQQVGQLMECCPALFSWPPEQRAAVLFGQLLGAGLTAMEAATCFATYPPAAKSTTLSPGLAELAAILAHSKDRDSSLGGRVPKVPAAQRTVAALLKTRPSAVHLICQSAGYLQQCAAELQQAGFTAADVAAVAWNRPELLWTDAAALVGSRVAVVQQELGLPAAQLVSLVASRKPSWSTCSISTVQERAAALAEGFGQAAAAAILLHSPQALNCDPTVWRRNLCYMAACGVADPKAVLRQQPQLLYIDHAASGFLQRRLLLQRCFQLTAVQLYEDQGGYLFVAEAPTLAQRLQFVEHRGQAHRLVAVPAGRRVTASPGQPAITVRVPGRPRREFLAAVGASQAEWEAWAAANPPAACPLYCWAQRAAEQEAARLTAVLPPELAQTERRQHSVSRRQS